MVEASVVNAIIVNSSWNESRPRHTAMLTSQLVRFISGLVTHNTHYYYGHSIHKSLYIVNFYVTPIKLMYCTNKLCCFMLFLLLSCQLHEYWASSSCIDDNTVYNMSQKQDTKTLVVFITSRNINIFSNFFHCLTHHKIFHKIDQYIFGATENAGVENAIRSKIQGWKMREWKMREYK